MDIEVEVKDEDAPVAFVNWANMTKVLDQVTTGGVKTSLLMHLDGSLLAVSGDSTIEKILAALVSNIWKGYEAAGQKSFGQETINMILFDCQEGNVVVCAVSRFLLCICADNTVHLGVLKAKLDAVSAHLSKPLSGVWKS